MREGTSSGSSIYIVELLKIILPVLGNQGALGWDVAAICSWENGGGLWAKDQPFPLSVLWDIDTPFLIALSE